MAPLPRTLLIVAALAALAGGVLVALASLDRETPLRQIEKAVPLANLQ